MTIENEEELEGLMRVGKVVATVLRDTLAAVRPGVTTAELDALAARRLEAYGARSAPMLDVGFPATICISVNEEVAHGVPGARLIEAGDMVNIDVSAELNSFYADNGASCVAGAPSPRQQRLLDATRAARDAAIAAIRPGVPYNHVGRVFELHARASGFTIVRNLCSHGIGRALHEAPDALAGYYRRIDRRRFHEGQVLAIEPFLTTGRDHVREAADGWTLCNSVGSESAQFEHTIVVERGGARIVTLAEPLAA